MLVGKIHEMCPPHAKVRPEIDLRIITRGLRVEHVVGRPGDRRRTVIVPGAHQEADLDALNRIELIRRRRSQEVGKPRRQPQRQHHGGIDLQCLDLPEKVIPSGNVDVPDPAPRHFRDERNIRLVDRGDDQVDTLQRFRPCGWSGKIDLARAKPDRLRLGEVSPCNDDVVFWPRGKCASDL
jgi:hypothetical protein